MAFASIADTLRLFNRKERHLVVQNCLGEAAVKLSPEFCGLVADTLGGRLSPPIRSDAWWAIDYHLDWLAGALKWHQEAGRNDRARARENTKDTIRGNQEDEDVIRGNLEDIDLVIASGNDVILLEAKGHSSFSNSQLASKMTRLKRLCDATTGTVGVEDSPHAVRLHFVLLSIRKPVRVDCAKWPAWAKNGVDPYWMPLKATSNHILVGRCDEDGLSDAGGRFWSMTETYPRPSEPSAIM